MTREQTASNRDDRADDRERIEKEDETIAESAVSDEAVDQVRHMKSPSDWGEKYSLAGLN
jgi:hypothetical protein